MHSFEIATEMLPYAKAAPAIINANVMRLKPEVHIIPKGKRPCCWELEGVRLFPPVI